MRVIKKEGGRPIKMWTDGVPVEDAALEQLGRVSEMPFVHSHIAVMPDVHVGIGATVGSVIPTVGAVIPAAVGVDLGCGMVAVRTSLTASDLPDNLHAMRTAIEAAVPHGRTNDGREGDRGAWHDLPDLVAERWTHEAFGKASASTPSGSLSKRFADICTRHPKLSRGNSVNHLGTLGTGNHFVEVCLDLEQRVWVMLHSGSRGVGGRIGQYFINLAKDDMRRWFINLPDTDLAYLPEGTDHFRDYVEAVGWAQDFAQANRYLMLRATVSAIGRTLENTLFAEELAVNCHHNYISRERHFGADCIVTRKGAVSAKEGELGIIPGSMGARSFIVRGKGNRDSFHSCSHGAGRALSRTEAKRRFTLDDHAAAVAGVECRVDADVIDETPAAYKSIEAVMAAQSDLVEVVAELKQVLCVKG